MRNLGVRTWLMAGPLEGLPSMARDSCLALVGPMTTSFSYDFFLLGALFHSHCAGSLHILLWSVDLKYCALIRLWYYHLPCTDCFSYCYCSAIYFHWVVFRVCVFEYGKVLMSSICLSLMTQATKHSLIIWNPSGLCPSLFAERCTSCVPLEMHDGLSKFMLYQLASSP